MQGSTDKFCPSCNAFKPLTDYHMNRAMADGRLNYCKPCRTRQNRESRRVARSEESSSEESAEVRLDTSNLYVMTNPRIPGEYKVGRSKGVEQRRETYKTAKTSRW